MLRRVIHALNICAILVFSSVITLHAAGPPSYRVLVVMSYHDGMPWEDEIKAGIQSALKGSFDIRYVYLNTKNMPSAGSERAKEAYRAYLEFQPDGVLAVDDDAQWLFVVPYLKNRVKTPVIFCGVNAEPDRYGYPASNVTGILERAHFRESIAFLRQLVPGATSIGFMVTDNRTGWGYVDQIRQELPGYPIQSFSISKVKTLGQARKACRAMKKQHDALFLVALEGLTDDTGRPLAERESFMILSQLYRKPVVGINRFNIRFNLLCGVVKTGQEQGATAAGMLTRAMSGTPVNEIPVTRNRIGKRVLNVTVMKSLGIRPRPFVLVGTELVETGK
jgi:ABC-type uncharacterized transport system substrate-binding protein